MDLQRSPHKRKTLSLPTELVSGPHSVSGLRSVCGGNDLSVVAGSPADRATSSEHQPEHSERTVVVLDRQVANLITPEEREIARKKKIYKDMLLTFFVKSSSKSVKLNRLYTLQHIFLTQRGVAAPINTHVGLLINETFGLTLDELQLPKGGHPRRYKFQKDGEWFRRGIAFPRGRFTNNIFTLQWDTMEACPQYVQDFCRAVNIRSPKEVTFHMDNLDKKVSIPKDPGNISAASPGLGHGVQVDADFVHIILTRMPAFTTLDEVELEEIEGNQLLVTGKGGSLTGLPVQGVLLDEPEAAPKPNMEAVALPASCNNLCLDPWSLVIPLPAPIDLESNSASLMDNGLYIISVKRKVRKGKIKVNQGRRVAK